MDNLAYVHNSVLPLLSDNKQRSISNNVNITEIIIAMTATTPIIEPIFLD